MEEWTNVQFIVCEVANERYALRISEVYEIIKLQKITVVHNSKPYMEGVINLRGKIIPIVNLHKRFELRAYVPTKASRIIVVESGEEIIGIVVDKVSRVSHFEEVQPIHDTVAGMDSGYFEGMGLSEEGVVSLLKIDKVLYE